MTTYENFVRMYDMSNATQTIIDLFGGVSGLASAIGRRPSTVQYWSDRGYIPAKNHDVVVAALRKHAPKAVDAATGADVAAD